MKYRKLYKILFSFTLSIQIIFALNLKYTKLIESGKGYLATFQTGLDIALEMKDSLFKEDGICFITNLKALYYDFNKIINIASILDKVNGKVVIIGQKKYQKDIYKFYKVIKTVTSKCNYTFYDSVFSRIIINERKIFLFLPTIDIAYSDDIKLLSKILKFSSILKKKVYVVDFPNIFSANKVYMPLVKLGFLNLKVPYLYGMTTGELSVLINEKYMQEPIDLTIVKMKNYSRNMWYDQMGMRWYLDYMNIPSIEVCMFYIGNNIMRSANISCDTTGVYHYNLFGERWINRDELIREFNKLGYKESFIFKNNISNNGLSLRIKDRKRFNPVEIYATILSLIGNLYPHHIIFYNWKGLNIPFDNEFKIVIETGMDINSYFREMENELNKFLSLRDKYIIY